MPTRKRTCRHRALCFSLCVAQAVFLLGLVPRKSSAADTSAAETAAADSARTESASNWTQWRGPQRDGRLQRITVPETLTGALDLVWEKNYSPSYSGPVIYDGLVYTTETVDRKSERVTAHRLEDGEVVWQKDWEGAMAVPFFAAANGDWIRATPACSSLGLVVVGMRDVMVCLDPKTGGEVWRVDFTEAMGTPLPMFGSSCSPLIDGEAVYMQTGGATVKLSMTDGSVIWKTLDNASSSSPGAFSSPAIATIAGKRQLLVQTRLELCGVDLDNGEVLWQEPIQAFRGMNILTPLAIGDRIFTSAHSGTAQLFSIEKDGQQWNVKEIWTQKQQAYMSSPVLVGDKIFLHLKNERMTALKTDSGDAVFTSRPMAKYASMVTDGERVLALTNKGELMLINAQSDTFDVIDQMKVADDSWAHLAISDEYIVIRDLKALKVFRRK